MPVNAAPSAHSWPPFERNRLIAGNQKAITLDTLLKINLFPINTGIELGDVEDTVFFNSDALKRIVNLPDRSGELTVMRM